MKKCPHCAEEIQDEAIKCKECGESLVEQDQAKGSVNNEKFIAMWCHLGALAGILIPFGNLLVPFVIWISKKEEYELVDDQGKESLNFQISVFLYSLVGIILSIIIVGLIFLIVLGLFAIIQVIKASIAANNGEKYRYPFCVRLIK